MAEPVNDWAKNILWVIAGGAIVFGLPMLLTDSPDRDRIVAQVTCDFSALDGQAPIKLGSYNAPLETLRLEGSLSDPFEETQYDFDGRAEYVIEGKSISADARGSFFLDSQLEPLGLMIDVVDANFGRDDLSILTLDENGVLEYSDNRAFAYTDPNFKLSHPMAMECQVSPPDDNWSWLPF